MFQNANMYNIYIYNILVLYKRNIILSSVENKSLRIRFTVKKTTEFENKARDIDGRRERGIRNIKV